MSMKRSKDDPKFVLAFEQGMLRSTFRSLFWAVIAEKKKRGSFTFDVLGQAVGNDKSKVSKWFNGDPNWTINTMAALAHALGIRLKISAVEEATGKVFSAAGEETTPAPTANLMPTNESRYTMTLAKITLAPANSNPLPDTRSTIRSVMI